MVYHIKRIGYACKLYHYVQDFKFSCFEYSNIMKTIISFMIDDAWSRAYGDCSNKVSFLNILIIKVSTTELCLLYLIRNHVTIWVEVFITEKFMTINIREENLIINGTT